MIKAICAGTERPYPAASRNKKLPVKLEGTVNIMIKGFLKDLRMIPKTTYTRKRATNSVNSKLDHILLTTLLNLVTAKLFILKIYTKYLLLRPHLHQHPLSYVCWGYRIIFATQ